ncbi:MAG: hypothetical protein ACRD6N_16725, partial [Pyrinomonadaceae bacterium]
PGAPFLPAGYIQRLAYFHFLLSAAVEDTIAAERLRFSGEPTQPTKEARYRRVRCKRFCGGAGDRYGAT